MAEVYVLIDEGFEDFDVLAVAKSLQGIINFLLDRDFYLPENAKVGLTSLDYFLSDYDLSVKIKKLYD